MKVVLLNGSPRKGNTYAALTAMKKGFSNIDAVEVKEIEAAKVQVSGCIACDKCGDIGKCVFDDDTNRIVDTVAEADAVVFATPVYWWGITAQLKLIIDKFYSQGSRLKANKKAGIIVIGEATQDDPQYEIIAKQFECICDYMDWEIKFCNTYTAAGTGDLASSAETMAEIEDLYKKL